MNISTSIKKHSSILILIAICILFVSLRFPSLFEPLWYGDEGIYQIIGRGIQEGRVVYEGVWDNKPPFLFFIYAFTNGDQFYTRLLSIVFGVLSVVFFYLLSSALFSRKKIAILTTFLYAVFFGVPTIEGNIANSENFMLFPIILSGYIVYTKYTIQNASRRNKWLFLAGLIISASFLIKVVALFDFVAFFLFLLIVHIHKHKIRRESLASFIAIVWPFVFGFLLPVFLTALYYALNGNFPLFFDAALGRNVNYVGYGNEFLIPQGFLVLKVLLLGLYILLLFLLKKHLKPEVLFILIWVGCSLFSAFFSQRPYIHYQLLVLASYTLLIGLLLIVTTFKKKFVLLFFVLIVGYFVYTGFDHWTLKRTVLYYHNFFSYITESKDVISYRSFFDRNNPRDYKIAHYIKQHTEPNEIIFLWGNNPQIYMLSETLPPGRYSVAYHMQTSDSTLKETASALRHSRPRFIIIMPDQQPIPFDMSSYTYTATIEEVHIYERID